MPRLEFLYEVALLRAFVAWEVFLEESFLRYLCGHASRHGVEVTVTGSYFRSLGDAQTAVLRGRDYVLWHNPTSVVKRCAAFLNNGRHEQVVGSGATSLEAIAAIRHRIAHGQADAKLKFDKATMQFAGRRYPGARPGRFLRDWNHSASPQQRWLRSLGETLCNLASQIT